ncbi:MAG: NFACT family protein, partial [Candidatus Eremiobacteraeota bacterium]|nr:NFACT family protein [Candidatus Eremiobacteraeota bacterium]
MFTDWLIIERLAREIDAQVARARVTALGHLPDGRIAVEYWQRGTTGLIVFDLFGRVPIVTLESGELEIASERGFIRTAGAALRGLTLMRVGAVPGERILSFEFATRSRFGVAAGYQLVAELIPRFGNLLLMKDDTVVAAYKEFRAGDSGRRTIAAGKRYEPPPRAASLQLPRLLAASAPADEAEQVLERAQRAAASKEGLFVYREGGALVQAHVVPLSQFEHLERSREPSLLPLLRETITQPADGPAGTTARHRRELARKLEQQQRRLQLEIAAVEKRLASVANRSALRQEAESIFATLHEIDEREHPQAKARASALFAQYKRLNNSAAPLEKR